MNVPATMSPIEKLSSQKNQLITGYDTLRLILNGLGPRVERYGWSDAQKHDIQFESGEAKAPCKVSTAIRLPVGGSPVVLYSSRRRSWGQVISRPIASLSLFAKDFLLCAELFLRISNGNWPSARKLNSPSRLTGNIIAIARPHVIRR